MIGTLGADVVATLVAPGVLPVNPMGARIEVPVTRAIVAYYRLAAYDEVTGLWTVVLDSPPAAGEFNLVWRTNDAEPPEMEVFIPLSIVASTAGAPLPPPGTLPTWAPSVQDVAEVTPNFTRGGFDDDRPSAGAEQGVYTDDTEPTAEHVDGLIVAACDEVQGRVGVPILPTRYALASVTARWHVAASITAPKSPRSADEADGLYRGFITNFRNSLDELVALARGDAARGGRLR